MVRFWVFLSTSRHHHFKMLSFLIRFFCCTFCNLRLTHRNISILGHNASGVLIYLRYFALIIEMCNSQVILKSLLFTGFDNHLILSGISENTHHILNVERIIAKSAESYLSFSLRWRCPPCTERYLQQQQPEDRDDNVDLEGEDLSLPILFGDEPPPLIDIEEEDDADDHQCFCRQITPLQFKV